MLLGYTAREMSGNGAPFLGIEFIKERQMMGVYGYLAIVVFMYYAAVLGTTFLGFAALRASAEPLRSQEP